MALNHQLHDQAEDDYIDMEVNSYSDFLCHPLGSPPHSREFEFQMASASVEKELTSPADELFYKGNLLPLHLPPRLQMVEKLLENSNRVYNIRNDSFEDFYGTPLMTTTTTPTTTSTPFESCNNSPSESCCVSRELNPEEYFIYPSEVSAFIDDNPKKSWAKKFKLIKQISVGSKLKASRAYVKSLFNKTSCSADSCTSATKVADEGTISQAKEALNKYARAAKKSPFGRIHGEKHQFLTTATRDVNKQKIHDDGRPQLNRRSFSMAIKRHSPNKFSSSPGSSSPPSSSNSNSSPGLPFLKRSSSTNSEIENPIQGAIAHCKRSQQLFQPRKTVSEVGFYSLSASKMGISESLERSGLRRG